METPTPRLAAGEIERYSRHLRIPTVGLTGQTRLKQAKVLIVGLGGLGSPLAAYLAAAGVGTLGLVEFDEVSLSNLQRQVLYETADVGKPKLWTAKARLQAQNPEITLVPHDGPIDADNALDLVGRYDLVADGSDNFRTRYVLNDACRRLGRPLVHASIYRFDGQLAVFAPGQGGCYRCLYPQPPEQAPSCSEGGVLGVLAGTMGTLQATEVLKLILGIGEPLTGKLLLYDALSLSTTVLGVPVAPECPLCGDDPQALPLGEVAWQCADDRLEADDDWEMAPAELAVRLGEVQLLDVGEAALWTGQVHGDLRHLPLSRLADALDGLDDARPIVTVCLSGSASAEATRILRAAGFANAWHLQGGLLAWQRHQETPSQSAT